MSFQMQDDRPDYVVEVVPIPQVLVANMQPGGDGLMGWVVVFWVLDRGGIGGP